MKKRILAMLLSCCTVVSMMGPVRAVPVLETEVEPAQETVEQTNDDVVDIQKDEIEDVDEIYNQFQANIDDMIRDDVAENDDVAIKELYDEYSA